jgi:hypothetical protein
MSWLAGGAATAVGVGELRDARHVVSDLATVRMELAAAALVAAQASGRGRSPPAAVVLAPALIATRVGPT